MWTRGELKSRAKDFLRKNYWKSFMIALVIFLVGGNDNLFAGGSTSSRVSGGQQPGIQLNMGDVFFGGYSSVSAWWMEWIGLPRVIFFSIGMALAALLVVLSFRIFIGAPLSVGGRTYFLKGVDGDADPVHLAWVFKSSAYLKVVKTMFMRGLYTFLWTLLLVIPGIVKSYAYRMVPYILAEEPDLEADEAIRRSMDMTKGEKMNMFVLDLSFLGWYILGALLLGIGIFFVHPYYEATYAQLYDTLKNGELHEEELAY